MLKVCEEKLFGEDHIYEIIEEKKKEFNEKKGARIAQ